MLLFSDVLGCADEPPDPASGVAHRKSVNPHPANVPIGERDPEALVEFPSAGRLVQSGEHMHSVFGMNNLLIRGWIVQEAPARSSGNRLVGLIHLQHALRLGVQHPENLLDMAGHLAITFALPVLPHTSNQESGPGHYDDDKA